ncbi:MAG: hypothetical protein KDN22_34220 [Verrucomicrobiae bacterium]|nr:hypothetical protein [Verrucomicrobiae bacterium]
MKLRSCFVNAIVALGLLANGAVLKAQTNPPHLEVELLRDSGEFRLFWEGENAVVEQTNQLPPEGEWRGLGMQSLLIDGRHTVTISSDIKRLFFRLRYFIPGELPANSADLAPPLSQTAFTSMHEATAFLYEGEAPAQIGVAPRTIEIHSSAVIRGKVFQRNNAPLSGVTISILNRPEFGLTLTREDGSFDIAVNGGGTLTVRYHKSGFCDAQRQVAVPWQDYACLPNVVLIPPDPAVTQIQFGSASPFQIHSATVQTDEDGTRCALLMFLPGTTADMELPDGSVVPLNAGNVRVTEFTVGEGGPDAMPAELPGNSAYTYCSDFSFDEAEALGATQVTFSHPVISYLENFLNFPVGSAVPHGSYDKQEGVWRADESGRIVKIVGVGGGTVELDVDGDGIADGEASLTALGVTAQERQQLAATYVQGQALWRTPLIHFTVKDMNWSGSGGGTSSGPPDESPEDDPPPDDDDDPPGFWVQTQRSFSSVAIAGTPYQLHYDSSRTRGYAMAREVRIPLSAADFFGTVNRIGLEVEIAGRVFTEDFQPGPSLETTFLWDGMDAYGRVVQGAMPATIRISYFYPGQYNSTTRFAQNGIGLVLTGSPTRDDVELSASYVRWLGTLDMVAQSIGGWTLNVHHAYDPNRQQMYLGDGSMRTVANIATTIRTIAGTGELPDGPHEPGTPATETSISNPWEVAAAADGTIVFGDASLHQIFRIGRDGVANVIAGTGSPGYSGDGGAALDAKINTPFGLDVAPDGTIYFCDFNNHVVRAIDPAGTIRTVAGTGIPGSSGDGGPALLARLRLPIGLDYANDGTIYIADANNHRIRAIATDGTIRTVAGTGVEGFSGDDGLATAARLTFPLGVAADTNGNIYIGDTGNARVRKVSPNGMITTIAGDGIEPLPGEPIGDGGSAELARLHAPTTLEVDSAGTLLINEAGGKRIRRISPTGLISSVAGAGRGGSHPADRNGDGGAALQALLGDEQSNSGPQGLAFHPDGSILVADSPNRRVRRIGTALPGSTDNEILIPSDNGLQLFRFDENGRHLETLNALTGDQMFAFQYDSSGRLLRVENGDGLVTEIARDATGNPTSITGPFGHVTTLASDANGCLQSVSDPLGRSYSFTYGDGALLLSETNPELQTTTFAYDAAGRVIEVDTAEAGAVALARQELTNGQNVILSIPGNNDAQFLVERLQGVGERRTYTDPAGLASTELRGQNEIDTYSEPDGSTQSVSYGGDPRFGLAAPVRSRDSFTLPGGQQMEVFSSRSAKLSNPDDLLSVETVTEVATLNGAMVTRHFDAASRTFTETRPENRTWQWSIDHMGRVTGLRLGDEALNTFSYDAKGQFVGLSRIANGDSRNFQLEYDGSGHLNRMVDPLARETSFLTNAAGQVTQLNLPGNRTVHLSYDGNGNPATVRPPGMADFLVEFREDGLMAEFTAPDSGEGPPTTRYLYDPAERLIAIEYPGGPTATFDWNAEGRLTQRFDGAVTTTYGYSVATGQIERLSTSDSSVLNVGWNGPAINSFQWTGPVAGIYQRTLNDRMITVQETINNVDPVLFTHDADGLMANAGDLTTTRLAGTGRVSEVVLGGITETYEYNPFGEITSQHAKFNGVTLMALELDYDGLGRVIAKTETIAGTTRNYSYSYNSSGWLQEVKLNDEVIESYNYDATGNLVGKNGVAGTVDAQGRLATFGNASYEYTDRGTLLRKLVGDQTTLFSYDGSGGLRSLELPDGRSIEYLIDGANHRIGKKVDGVLQRGFLYSDRIRVIAELDETGAVVNRFVYFGTNTVPAYMIRGTTRYRMLYDINASLRLVVEVDNGAIAQRIDYDAFGTILNDSNPGFQPFAFGGGLYDPDTGLVRCGVRDYDSTTGRWTARDPIYFRSTDLNLYGYVNNLPLQSYDPLGAWGVGAHFSGPGGYFAFGPGFGGQESMGFFVGWGPQGPWGTTYQNATSINGGFGGEGTLFGGGLDWTNAKKGCELPTFSQHSQLDAPFGTLTSDQGLTSQGRRSGVDSVGVDISLSVGLGFGQGISTSQ